MVATITEYRNIYRNIDGEACTPQERDVMLHALYPQKSSFTMKREAINDYNYIIQTKKQWIELYDEILNRIDDFEITIKK